MEPKNMTLEQNEEIKEKLEEPCKLLKELRRRVDITYRTRIIATDRLKAEREKHRKLNIYYSCLVTAISVVSIGSGTFGNITTVNNIDISQMILALSISLTYYMFYVDGKNLQERAYRMEETFKRLDVLKNKLDIFIEYKFNDCGHKDLECKKFYRQYEQIISSIENHQKIDYMKYKIENLNKKEELTQKEIKDLEKINNIVRWYRRWDCLKIILQWIVPFILFLYLFRLCIYNY